MKKEKHPVGAWFLVFTEVWERFAFYLMLAVFTLFLLDKRKTGGWEMSQVEVSKFKGLFNAAIYLASLGGSLLAEQLLGAKKAISLGLVFMAVGYWILGVQDNYHLWCGCTLIVFGSGLFKPNIGAMLSSLYSPKDSLRDVGFSYFYLGVNLGAFFSPIVGAYVQQKYGWIAAFKCAAIGLLIGLIVFTLGRKYLNPHPDSLTEGEDSQEVQGSSLKRLQVTLALCSLVIVFWAAFHQNETSWTFFAKDSIDASWGGIFAKEINPILYQSVNSFGVLFLTPVVVYVFTSLGKIGKEPSTPVKIALGIAITGLSFMILGFACLSGGNTGRVSPLWIIEGYLVITVGELLVSPIGLSLITKLAPKNRKALFLSIWYIVVAIGNYVGGQLGVLYATTEPHSTFFFEVGWACVLAGLITLAMSKWLNKYIPKKIVNVGDLVAPPSPEDALRAFFFIKRLPKEDQELIRVLVDGSIKERRRVLQEALNRCN